MNKSTAGWNIVQILLDFVGGVLSIAQLAIDASLQGSVSSVMGNPIKFGLGNVSIFFDVIFMVQHYILYTKKAAVLDEEHGRDEEGRALLGDRKVSEGSNDGEESDLLAYRQEEDDELSKDGERRDLLAGRNGSSSSGSSTIRGG